MKKSFSQGFLFLIFFAACLFTAQGHAFSARAQWLDSRRLVLKLPAGLAFNAAGFRYALLDTTEMFRPSTAIPLPWISASGSFVTLDTSHLSLQEIEYLITRPLKVVTTNGQQEILDSTAIQYAGLLDQNFYYEGEDLGGRCNPASCQVKLWAPTAQGVRLSLFNQSSQSIPSAVYDLQRETNGVWSLSLPAGFKNFFYLFEVQVYQPLTDRIETHTVTDPYSASLALNGAKSQLVDMNAPETQPLGWERLQKPFLSSARDAVIYELHIRDFSANDSTVPSPLRGTYLAFTQDTQGTRYLRELAQAGLTHIHLLPLSDSGSVNEDKSQWKDLPISPSGDLQKPQELIGQVRTEDSYNWGYDPVHYLAPEGSYAVHGDGFERIKETRAMVKALSEMGLRVVQDVVFNHTYENALSPYSVFDKIVPLYYYRLDDEGRTYSSSCCADTASEHRMMEKLMRDSVLFWAKNYKIDGFRFDLMSFHSRSTILRVRDALRSLTLAGDGVDGSKILIYGEGWTFGSFYNAHPDEAMTHENSFGSGVGFFNDRLRDAARGGTTNSAEKSDQGFVTGLFFDFNQEPANRNTPLDPGSQRDKLLHLGDVIKVGLAGNLRDVTFRDHLGNTITGYSLKFRGQPVAYGAVPAESINYVSAHDGYTVWDAIQAKAPFFTPNRTPRTATTEERQRMQQLLLALPLLGQGIPFIEAGTELLRSKNGDQDSYNSGDYFNRIDWTAQGNYWGEALPPAWKNLNDWSFWEPRLKTPELQASSDLIARTRDYFKALLRLRQNHYLFRLQSAADVSTHLRFIDNDSKAEPGLIAMHLQDSSQSLLVFFNAAPENRLFNHVLLKKNWRLHPLLNEAVDPALQGVAINSALGSIRLPGRSTVVLITEEP